MLGDQTCMEHFHQQQVHCASPDLQREQYLPREAAQKVLPGTHCTWDYVLFIETDLCILFILWAALELGAS